MFVSPPSKIDHYGFVILVSLQNSTNIFECLPNMHIAFDSRSCAPCHFSTPNLQELMAESRLRRAELEEKIKNCETESAGMQAR